MSQQSYSERRQVEALEAHPVAMLSRTLATHPALRPQDALTDVLASRPAGGAPVESWAAAARHALLASHAWATEPRSALSKEQEWSAVADVAALAQVVSVLDRQLYDAASAHPGGDPVVVQALHASLASGLRTAAGEASRLAAAGPLPDWGEPLPEPVPTRVIVVRSPEDVAAAQERIAAQVTSATDLGPNAVMLIAAGQARILSAAAAGLHETDPQRAGHATRLARQLAGIATDRRQLATLTADDPRPVAQTREVLQHLAQAQAGNGGTAYRSALCAVVDRSPRVVRALSRHAEASVRTGRWLVIDTEARRAKDLLWRRATSVDPEPRLCVSLSAAAAVTTAAPPRARPNAAAAAPPPRQTLSPNPPRISRWSL